MGCPGGAFGEVCGVLVQIEQVGVCEELLDYVRDDVAADYLPGMHFSQANEEIKRITY